MSEAGISGGGSNLHHCILFPVLGNIQQSLFSMSAENKTSSGNFFNAPATSEGGAGETNLDKSYRNRLSSWNCAMLSVSNSRQTKYIPQNILLYQTTLAKIRHLACNKCISVQQIKKQLFDVVFIFHKN